VNQLAWALRSIRNAPRGPRVGAFFDLDGTLVEGFTALSFVRDFLSRGEISAGDLLSLTRAGVGHRRSPDNGQGIIERGIALLAGRSLDALEDRAQEVFVRRIARAIRPEAREVVQAHRAAGHTLVMATAASPLQARPVARDLGIDHLLATSIVVQDGVVTGALDGPPLWGANKARAVVDFAGAHDIDLTASFGYGNGREDRLFLQAVGRPVAVRPDAGLSAIATEARIPVLNLEAPPTPGLRSVLRTAGAVGVFNSGVMATLAASPVLGKAKAFRRGFGPTTDLALAAAGVRVNAQGLEHIESARPAVFVFNHQSNLDPLVVVKLVRRDITGVGKQEVADNPQTRALRFLDFALIDRSNPEAARASMHALVKRIQAGMSVFIAPEGTRMPTPRLGPFKRGAFHLAMDAGAPLVPIVIRNSGSLWPRGAKRIASGVLDVVVLPPIATESWTRDQVGTHADDVRAMFARVLDHWPDGA